MFHVQNRMAEKRTFSYPYPHTASNKLMSIDIDSVISAEHPNPQEYPVLFEIIKASMIHEICSHLEPRSENMDNWGSKGLFPMQTKFHYIQNGDDGYTL